MPVAIHANAQPPTSDHPPAAMSRKRSPGRSINFPRYGRSLACCPGPASCHRQKNRRRNRRAADPATARRTRPTGHVPRDMPRIARSRCAAMERARAANTQPPAGLLVAPGPEATGRGEMSWRMLPCSNARPSTMAVPMADLAHGQRATTRPCGRETAGAARRSRPQAQPPGNYAGNAHRRQRQTGLQESEQITSRACPLPERQGQFFSPAAPTRQSAQTVMGRFKKIGLKPCLPDKRKQLTYLIVQKSGLVAPQPSGASPPFLAGMFAKYGLTPGFTATAGAIMGNVNRHRSRPQAHTRPTPMPGMPVATQGCGQRVSLGGARSKKNPGKRHG